MWYHFSVIASKIFGIFYCIFCLGMEQQPRQKRTRPLYWEDTYRFSDKACVLEVHEHPAPRGAPADTHARAVILDRTIFHPQGGNFTFFSSFLRGEKRRKCCWYLECNA